MMGTRADFYVGMDNGEWLGSIAWDGYPSEIPDSIKLAGTEGEYRDAVDTLLRSRDDGTLPAMGWPWPWNDSALTDWAYAWDPAHDYHSAAVMASSFGSPWMFCPKEGDGPDEPPEGDAPLFTDMTDRKRVTLGARSGLVILRS
jgi:hypothetical protein